MRFNFWMVIPFLVTISVAGGSRDYRFAVPDEQFRMDARIMNAQNVCVASAVESAYLYSEKLKYPLEHGKLYLRAKVKGNQYGWYSGGIKTECYKNLHAFNLQTNHLTVLEASHLRFYASTSFRPFQDEGEIYFDKKYMYSSRVATLFFMKNGKWQKLIPTSLTGVVEVNALPDSTYLLWDSEMFYAPVTFAPVDTGLFFATVFAPGYYPYTTGLHVTSGKTSTLKTVLLPLDTVVYKIETKVTPKRVKEAKTLEEVEVLYDQFIEDLAKTKINQDSTEFDTLYPRVKNPPPGMDKSNAQYSAYATTFEATRFRARAQWLSGRLSGILEMNQALRDRLNDLQNETLRLNVTLRNLDWTDTSCTFVLGDSAGRVDVAFEGHLIPKPNVPDSVFFAAMKDSTQAKFVVTLENKPVWKYDGSKVKSRHQYRYIHLDVYYHDMIYSGEGSFVLPMYIFAEPEVQAWLLPKQEKNIADSSKDTLAVVKDTVLEDVSRAVAEIDSGSFRYKNKIVRMSPFAIRKTEVTVGEYLDVTHDSTMNFEFKDSLMPAHNVNWEKARNFCLAVGGDLPTEAQWEYAARTGNNEGFIWRNRMGALPFEYAVFRADGPQRVASAKPNAWGLYDVSGNVAEWTRDSYSWFSFYVENENPTGSFFDDSRVFKGGSWKSKLDDELDLTDSDDEDPRYWSNSLGFRCVFPSKVNQK